MVGRISVWLRSRVLIVVLPVQTMHDLSSGNRSLFVDSDEQFGDVISYSAR